MPPKEIRSSRSVDLKKDPRVLANRYEIIKKLGSGSHGTVFLVSDLKNSKELNVVKEIYIGNLQPDETVGAVTEARLLCKLNHPGIVKFLDSFIDGDFFCIVTEYCEGGDLDIILHSYKESGKELDKSTLLNWFVQLLLAVQYIHKRNVLHRDLKAKNIFLKNNMIKIGDFGISRILQGNLDKATTFTGTPYYMAPEVLNQDGYDSKSDIWSLGVILYQMCHLEQAFVGKSLPDVIFKITKGDMPELSPKFGDGLKNIYDSMLCRDPVKRTSSTDILKTKFVSQLVEKLDLVNVCNNTSSDNTIKFHSNEIAEFLRLPKKKKAVDKSFTPPSPTQIKESLSARDLLKQRKKQKADIEAEKLNKITASVYEESRQKYSTLKQRQSVVAVPFVNNGNNHSEDHVCNNRIINAVEEFSNEDEKTLIESSDVINEFLEKWTQYTNLLNENEKVTNNTNDHTIVGKKLTYTHCFGESVDDKTKNEEACDEQTGNELTYTHCFGEDDTGVNDLCKDLVNGISERSLSHMLQSSIPDDEATANTFYSTFDFEDDSDVSDSELDEVANCLQSALDLSDDSGNSTFIDSSPIESPVNPKMEIRQQKLTSLRKECVKMLGEEGFSRVYKFLNKARFESRTSMSEPIIMKKLRKLVTNPRDCFLVDQLLFLEKQH